MLGVLLVGTVLSASDTVLVQTSGGLREICLLPVPATVRLGVPFEVVDRYELYRYITPYGIGLDLDEDGWSWWYDVTDYMHLLRDSVQLEAGNWQELLDLKFHFIEGEPAREVLRNIWAMKRFGAYQAFVMYQA